MPTKLIEKIRKRANEINKAFNNEKNSTVDEVSINNFDLYTLKKLESKGAQLGIDTKISDAYKNIGYGVCFNEIKSVADKLIYWGNAFPLIEIQSSILGDDKRKSASFFTNFSVPQCLVNFFLDYVYKAKGLKTLCEKRVDVLLFELPENSPNFAIYQSVFSLLKKYRINFHLLSEGEKFEISNTSKKISVNKIEYDTAIIIGSRRDYSLDGFIGNLFEINDTKDIDKAFLSLKDKRFIIDNNQSVEISEFFIDKDRILILQNQKNTAQSISLMGISESCASEIFVEKDSFDKLYLEDGKLKLRLLPMQTKVIYLSYSDFLEPNEKTYLTLSDKDWSISKTPYNVFVLDRWIPKFLDVTYPQAFSLDISDMTKKIGAKQLTLNSSFFASNLDNKNAFFVVEKSGVKKVELNGKTLTEKADCVAVPGMYQYSAELIEGENNLAVSYSFDELNGEINIENAYLVGNFGVKVLGESRAKNCIKFKETLCISKAKEKIKLSSIASQGMYFFGGKLTVQKNINIQRILKNTFLAMKLNNAFAIVFINGKKVGEYLWDMQEFNVSDFLIEGENVITIEVYSGLRNILGPFHNKDGEPEIVTEKSFPLNPLNGDFIDNGYTENYFIKDFGVSTDV